MSGLFDGPESWAFGIQKQELGLRAPHPNISCEIQVAIFLTGEPPNSKEHDSLPRPSSWGIRARPFKSMF